MPITMAMAILGGAALTAGAGYLASRGQTRAATESTNIQLEALREQRADLAAAVDAGIIDLDSAYEAAIGELQPLATAGMEEMNVARKLLMDPSAIMDRPGTRFQMEQGTEALQAAFSRTSGGGLSGRAIKAATEYGQNFAATALDRELARLQPFINIGVTAKTNIAQMGVGLGTSKANIRLGLGTQLANLTGQAGQVSGALPITKQNITTDLLSGLTGQGTNILSLMALRPDLFGGGGTKPKPAAAGGLFSAPPVNVFRPAIPQERFGLR